MGVLKVSVTLKKRNPELFPLKIRKFFKDFLRSGWCNFPVLVVGKVVPRDFIGNVAFLRLQL